MSCRSVCTSVTVCNSWPPPFILITSYQSRAARSHSGSRHSPAQLSTPPPPRPRFTLPLITLLLSFTQEQTAGGVHLITPFSPTLKTSKRRNWKDGHRRTWHRPPATSHVFFTQTVQDVGCRCRNLPSMHWARDRQQVKMRHSPLHPRVMLHRQQSQQQKYRKNTLLKRCVLQKVVPNPSHGLSLNPKLRCWWRSSSCSQQPILAQTQARHISLTPESCCSPGSSVTSTQVLL